MIYIVGDTHGNIDLNKVKKLKLNAQDFIIVAGDWGAIWDLLDLESGATFKFWKDLPCTTFVVDGNHENHELLNEHKIVEFHNAKCNKLAENIYRVRRGEILNLNNLTFFCFGGANSTDKECRQDRITWWKEEHPTFCEIYNGIENIKKVKGRVDYVITHTAPTSFIDEMNLYMGDITDSVSEILESFLKILIFKYWYFGHFHFDEAYEKFTCVYNKVKEVK